MKVKFISQIFSKGYFVDVAYPNKVERYSNIFSMDKEYEVYDIFPDQDGSTHVCLISDSGFLVYCNVYHVKVVSENKIPKFYPESSVKITSTENNNRLK